VPPARDISVVIPYCNREKYIDEAIQSVLAQTLEPLEIIVVNDCSRESSRRYLDQYAGICRIIDLPVNIGLAGARNVGIHAARGRYIAFLDDDDMWLPMKLEIQRRYMEEYPDCDIVHSAAWFFFLDEPEVLFMNFKAGPMTLAQALTNEHWAIIPTCLVRSEVARAVGGFDVSFRECEDRDFIIRCCAAGCRIEGINEGLARIRRQRQEGLTKRPWRMFRTDLRIGWKYREFYLRAYGVRGLATFVLEKIQIFLQGLWMRSGMKWPYVWLRYKRKAGYVDPVLARIRAAREVAQPSSDNKTLVGRNV